MIFVDIIRWVKEDYSRSINKRFILRFDIFRWGDWHCKTTTDGVHDFKPLCQKDKDSGGQNFETRDDDKNKDKNQDIIVPDTPVVIINDNDEDNESDGKLPDQTKCYDEGVSYKSLKRNILSNIFSVESALLCQEMCAENPECSYWIWSKKRNPENNKCKLTNGILSTGFRRQKPSAISGTMLNGCKPQNDPSGNAQLTADYCVEYGALYSGGDESVLINNLNSAEECRARCLEENGCRFFSFRAGRRRGNRCVLRSAQDFRVFSSQGSISGTDIS